MLVCTLLTGSIHATTGISEVRTAVDTTHREQIYLQILFSRSYSEIEAAFADNSINIESFFAALDSLSATSGVQFDSFATIRSSASPEGRSTANMDLSQRRAEAVKALCAQRGLDSISFNINSIGEDWQTLGELIGRSGLKGREQTVKVINNTPRYIFKDGQIVGGRKKAAMELEHGMLWRQLDTLFFPYLRQATLTLGYSYNPDAAASKELTLSSEDATVVEDKARTSLPLPAIKTPETLSLNALEFSSRPLVALKTNLLFDAASLINIGIELPLGQRYSIAAEAYFPWWRNPAKDFTAQMMAGTLEGRYWLGDRRDSKALTGFFAGAFVGGGVFDFQMGRLTEGRGVQGDYFLLAGLSAGYSHSISPSLRMEYSIGAGYLRSRVRDYVSVKDTKFGDIKVMQYPWDVKIITGLVPAKASVSLVWMIDSKREVRYE